MLASLAHAQVNNAKILPAAGVAAASTVVGNLAIYFIALMFDPLIVPSPATNQPEPLPFFAVIAASLMGVLVGTVGFAIAGRFIPRPVLVFAVGAVAFGLLSFGGPFGLVGITPITLWALNLMHVVSTVGIVGAFLGLATAPRAQ